jgi:hypothetical protein
MQVKQTDESHAQTTYQFGALERRGVLAGLSHLQLSVIGTTSVLCVVLIVVAGISGLVASAVLMAAALGLSFKKSKGRALVHWLPVMTCYLARRLTKRTAYRSPAPSMGTHIRIALNKNGEVPDNAAVEVVDRATHTPEVIGDVEITETPYRSGEPLGMLADRDRHTFTAVFSCDPRPFVLESKEVQEQRLAAWGSWLANIARSGSLSRLQILERTVISDTDSLKRYFDRQRDPRIDDGSSLIQSYRELLDAAGSVGQEHEILLCAQIARTNPATEKRIRRHGKDTDIGAGKLLANECQALMERLRRAAVNAEPLSADGLARTLKDGFDPFTRPQRKRLQARSKGQASSVYAWPLAADETRETYATDSAMHKTMWIGEWPRVDVDATFLSPLLLHTQKPITDTGGQSVRTLSIVMEPVSISDSVRQAEASVRQDIADDSIRRRFGFMPTARRRKQQESANRREQELALGHAELRTTGYVTVSATDTDTLEDAVSDVQDAAQLSHLETYPLRGEQASAFCAGALPLCRGL